MKITSRSVQGVEILKLEGKLTIGAGDVALRVAVFDALAQGKKQILLDLAGVSTIDSSGVGELVSSYATAANKGGKIKLLNLSPKLRDILMLTQLITVFEVFDNEDEALKSFS